MKKIKRSRDFELLLEIKGDDFIKPPREAQRNAVLNRAMKEFAADLEALHKETGNFVPGREYNVLNSDRQNRYLPAQEIMEDWLIPVMKSMATIVTENGGDILEIGFGRGISADFIQAHEISSHTVIECNDTVIPIFEQWKKQYPDRHIRFIHGLWQDTIRNLGQFDGVFFHTYPLNEDEYMNYVNGSITFAEHFFEHASRHLKKGGAFTYFSNEINSLSREHQRRLLEYFSSFTVKVVPLTLPQDVIDTWWADSIVVIKAIK